MTRTHRVSLKAALLGCVAVTASPALAADVTPQRLANPEPQNWLMNHRTYDGQRFSPLDIMRNATITVPDKVKEFQYKASGGKLSSLFDGTERVLSIDAIAWYNRAIYMP